MLRSGCWRWRSVCAVLALLCAGSAAAQVLELHTQSNIVLVPTLVQTKHGANVYELKASDFVVEDNGVAQKVVLDDDSDLQPLSVVVAVQTGRSAAAEFEKMRGFGTMLEAMLGDAPHSVAVVTFDSHQQLIKDFTSDTESALRSLRNLQPGDDGAAILDVVSYSIHLLDQQPKQNRRVLLLVSETRDHGSKTVKIQDLVQQVGASNTTIYSVAFSPAATEFLDDLRYGGGSAMNLLAPFMMAVAAMKKNVAHTVAQMSGGEYLRFTTQRGFDQQLGRLGNRVHNQYMLSFQPQNPHPGLHAIRVTMPQYPQLVVRARTDYWAGGPAGSTLLPAK